ncbi:hypothetical protein T02_5290 [Trichinella nativa]|uniref:Uncharacterized protein n=1 Tax=Trichinella nativa TaxID=6335 RepID=A0A0V1KNL1_9BILA|nr:hypothetical protein T02_1543 [Trichinella nativa]KRZ48728.1 hypothetical protein T02_5290 [Trichinella nativa]
MIYIPWEMFLNLKITVTGKNALSMKLPTYWTSQCHVWYKQVDAQLHICQMCTDTIHYYILRALHQRTA